MCVWPSYYAEFISLVFLVKVLDFLKKSAWTWNWKRYLALSWRVGARHSLGRKVEVALPFLLLRYFPIPVWFRVCDVFQFSIYIKSSTLPYKVTNVQLKSFKKSSLGEDPVDKIAYLSISWKNTQGQSVPVSVAGKILSFSLQWQALQSSSPLGHFGTCKGKRLSPVVSNMTHAE